MQNILGLKMQNSHLKMQKSKDAKFKNAKMTYKCKCTFRNANSRLYVYLHKRVGTDVVVVVVLQVQVQAKYVRSTNIYIAS